MLPLPPKLPGLPGLLLVLLGIGLGTAGVKYGPNALRFMGTPLISFDMKCGAVQIGSHNNACAAPPDDRKPSPVPTTSGVPHVDMGPLGANKRKDGVTPHPPPPRRPRRRDHRRRLARACPAHANLPAHPLACTCGCRCGARG